MEQVTSCWHHLRGLIMDLEGGRHLRNLIMYSGGQATRTIHHDSTGEVMEDVQF